MANTMSGRKNLLRFNGFPSFLALFFKEEAKHKEQEATEDEGQWLRQEFKGIDIVPEYQSAYDDDTGQAPFLYQVKQEYKIS